MLVPDRQRVRAAQSSPLGPGVELQPLWWVHAQEGCLQTQAHLLPGIVLGSLQPGTFSSLSSGTSDGECQGWSSLKLFPSPKAVLQHAQFLLPFGG